MQIASPELRDCPPLEGRAHTTDVRHLEAVSLEFLKEELMTFVRAVNIHGSSRSRSRSGRGTTRHRPTICKGGMFILSPLNFNVRCNKVGQITVMRALVRESLTAPAWPSFLPRVIGVTSTVPSSLKWRTWAIVETSSTRGWR